ncbi:WD repeat-containing protein pop2 [Hondaea fermentalgiana]|uniref:WD repeat-containing protein pop2 n=1 Tax=Hondaea fermentalgiana TaxID=2315210 RepID=A0A2R5GXA1_9STRA|nr:WD repeat-containing protein pop2 [Hondaea fermentalgiana]|eukprot:GBG34959.1 WD repeat-containing protein pop2 [Hondaea fermentalgiana]
MGRTIDDAVVLSEKLVVALAIKEMKVPSTWAPVSVAIQGHVVGVGDFLGDIYLIDLLASSTVLPMLHGHKLAVCSMIFDGDTLISGSKDGTICFWNITDGECTKKIVAGAQGVRTQDGSIRNWKKPIDTHCMKLNPSVGPAVYDLAVHNDVVAAGLDDQTVRIFERGSGEEWHALIDATETITSIAMNERWLGSGSLDCKVRVYARSDFNLVHVLEGHMASVEALSLEDDWIISGSADKTVRVWDAKTGNPLHVLQEPTAGIHSVSAFGSKIAAQSDDTVVRIWDIATGALEHVMDGTETEAPISSVFPSPGLAEITSNEKLGQEQVLGFSIVAVERTTNRLVNLIRPLWHRIFPFKDHDVSLALKDPVAAADAQARMQYQPQYQHQQQQQFQQFPFQQGARQQQTAPAFASTRYADERSGDPRQRSQDPFVASPPPLPATRRASDYAEGATSSRGPAGAGVRRRGRAHQASNSSTLSDDLSDDLVSEDDSEVSAKLPPAAVHASAAEIDKAVLLAIEAQQTHVVVEKLFYIAVLLMAIVGVVLFRVDFTRNWSGQKIANVEPAMGFEGIYGILLVLTMAFRSDFPFNLGILMLVVFFAGVVFGTIISRNAFAKPLENQSDE